MLKKAVLVWSLAAATASPSQQQQQQQQQGSVVSVLFAGAIAGALFGGLLVDQYGRRRTIHLQNVFYICGGMSLALAQRLDHLLFGRFLMGVGTTISSIAEVPYLIEFTDPKTRGLYGSVYEVMVTFGVLTSYIGNYVTYNQKDSWRTGFGLPAVFALGQSALLVFCPESPKWLLKRGRLQEALQIYKRVFGDSFTLDQLQPDVSSLRNAAASRNGESPIEPTVTFHQSCRPFAICFLLNILSQFSGGTTVRVYAPTIFADAGISETTALLFNIMLGLIKFAVVLTSVRVVDSMGRKALLTVGNALIGLGLLVLTIAFSKSSTIDSGGFLAGCALVMGGYSASWGPILYLISSEMFPVEIRGRSLSANMIVLNSAQLLSTLSFLPLVEAWGAVKVFAALLCLVVVTGLVIWAGFVETSGKEHLQILSDLRLQHAKFFSFNGLFELICQNTSKRCPSKPQGTFAPSPLLDASASGSNAHDDIPNPIYSSESDRRRL